MSLVAPSYHRRLCGKTRLQGAVEKIQVLENTVKLLRCKEAHLANKCSEYCNECSGYWMQQIEQ